MQNNRPDLDELLRKSKEAWDKLSPTERATMLKTQREGYARAEASWPKPKFKMIDGVKVYDSYEDYCND